MCLWWWYRICLASATAKTELKQTSLAVRLCVPRDAVDLGTFTVSRLICAACSTYQHVNICNDLIQQWPGTLNYSRGRIIPDWSQWSSSNQFQPQLKGATCWHEATTTCLSWEMSAVPALMQIWNGVLVFQHSHRTTEVKHLYPKSTSNIREYSLALKHKEPRNNHYNQFSLSQLLAT